METLQPPSSQKKKMEKASADSKNEKTQFQIPNFSLGHSLLLNRSLKFQPKIVNRLVLSLRFGQTQPPSSQFFVYKIDVCKNRLVRKFLLRRNKGRSGHRKKKKRWKSFSDLSQGRKQGRKVEFKVTNRCKGKGSWVALTSRKRGDCLSGLGSCIILLRGRLRATWASDGKLALICVVNSFPPLQETRKGGKNDGKARKGGVWKIIKESFSRISEECENNEGGLKKEGGVRAYGVVFLYSREVWGDVIDRSSLLKEGKMD